jgi:hypothetical protein
MSACHGEENQCLLVQFLQKNSSSRLKDEHSSDPMSLLEYEGMIFLREKA